MCIPNENRIRKVIFNLNVILYRGFSQFLFIKRVSTCQFTIDVLGGLLG